MSFLFFNYIFIFFHNILAYSQLSTILASSFKCSVSMFSSKNYFINLFLISSLLSILDNCLVLLKFFSTIKYINTKLDLCKKQVCLSNFKSKFFNIHNLDLTFDIHKLRRSPLVKHMALLSLLIAYSVFDI